MFNEAGANREHTDRIIDQIRIIKNIQIAALIIQDGKNSFKVSFRSAGAVSVNTIASLLGGGGHPRAAGANLKGSLDHVTAKVMEAVGTLLHKDKFS